MVLKICVSCHYQTGIFNFYYVMSQICIISKPIAFLKFHLMVIIFLTTVCVLNLVKKLQIVPERYL